MFQLQLLKSVELQSVTVFASCLYFFLHIFEAESCIISAGLEVAIIAQAGLELLIFLPQTPKCQNYRTVPLPVKCTCVCQTSKKTGTRIIPYLWFLESLFTPSPYPKPLQLRVWVSLPFPAASLSYINQPLQIWAVLAPGWIALVFFALGFLSPPPLSLSPIIAWFSLDPSRCPCLFSPSCLQ